MTPGKDTSRGLEISAQLCTLPHYSLKLEAALEEPGEKLVYLVVDSDWNGDDFAKLQTKIELPSPGMPCQRVGIICNATATRQETHGASKIKEHKFSCEGAQENDMSKMSN